MRSDVVLSRRALLAEATAAAISERGTVNETWASPSVDTFCTIMSTKMPASATSSNTFAATPGVSGTPLIVMRACD